MADEIIVLDEDPCQPEPPPTHIYQSPFATAKKKPHVLQAENEKLFEEFVEHCGPSTKDCPDVLSFLKTKHDKASPEYLSSVEFRNTLGRCLTRAQSNRSKTFVYINELCTVLRQHSQKKRQSLIEVDSSNTAVSTSSTPSTPLTSAGAPRNSNTRSDPKTNGKIAEAEPSTSGRNDNSPHKDVKKSERRLKKEVAHLENLLKMYNEEICRLQQAELSLNDMETEDSAYIQENKLKNKMMKIYKKLCALKGCSSGTGRVIEHKIFFKSTRYPEINKKIERFINSPEAKSNPPDFQDVLQQVVKANTTYKLCLSKVNLEQIARDAFRETASQIQERRHLDLVYNFGCHLTDKYKSGQDPARIDKTLENRLRCNREVALTHLSDVITKYSRLQDEQEDEELMKKQKNDKTVSKPEKGKESSEDEDESEDESSGTDIEEELKASMDANGSDNEEDEEKEADKLEEAGDAADEAGSRSEDVAAAAPEQASPEELLGEASEDSLLTGEGEASGGSEGFLSDPSDPAVVAADSTVVDKVTTATDVLTEATTVEKEEPEFIPSETTERKSPALNGVSSHSSSPPITVANGDGEKSNEVLPHTRMRSLCRQKRKRQESGSNKTNIDQDGNGGISVDTVFSIDSPTDDSTVACIGTSTRPPGLQQSKKRKMVDQATQCDPEETIVLSDSES